MERQKKSSGRDSPRRQSPATLRKRVETGQGINAEKAQNELNTRANILEENQRAYRKGKTGHFPPRNERTIQLERTVQSGLDEARDIGKFPVRRDNHQPISGALGVATPQDREQRPVITFSGSTLSTKAYEEALMKTSAKEQIDAFNPVFNKEYIKDRRCAAQRINQQYHGHLHPTGESWVGENNPHPMIQGQRGSGSAMMSCQACQEDFPHPEFRQRNDRNDGRRSSGSSRNDNSRRSGGAARSNRRRSGGFSLFKKEGNSSSSRSKRARESRDQSSRNDNSRRSGGSSRSNRTLLSLKRESSSSSRSKRSKRGSEDSSRNDNRRRLGGLSRSNRRGSESLLFPPKRESSSSSRSKRSRRGSRDSSGNSNRSRSGRSSREQIRGGGYQRLSGEYSRSEDRRGEKRERRSRERARRSPAPRSRKRSPSPKRSKKGEH